jgi:hypothetical protein
LQEDISLFYQFCELGSSGDKRNISLYQPISGNFLKKINIDPQPAEQSGGAAQPQVKVVA